MLPDPTVDDAARAVKPVEYRDIPDFPHYRVGDDGSVWSCRTRGGRFVDWFKMRPVPTPPYGRLVIGLRRDRKLFRPYLSRIVLTVFVGPCPDGLEGCHNDGDLKNNALTNLRWDTPKSNQRDRERHGRTSRGARNGRAKLTEDTVQEIRRLYLEGGADQYQLADRFGVGQSTIGRIVRGEHWRGQ